MPSSRRVTPSRRSLWRYRLRLGFAWTRDPAWLLLIGGVALCSLGLGLVANSAPSSKGTLGSLPIVWYVGLAALALSIIVKPRQKVTVVIAVIAVTAVITATPSVFYVLPRFPWTAKQVGLTSYIDAHGSLNGLTGEYYRDWPGFYSAATIISHALGIHDPMSLARWWTPTIDLASMFAVQAVARRFTTSVVRSWYAALLFELGNTIQQDYFSPQSVGFFLSLVVIALGFVMWRSRHRERTMLSYALVVLSFGLAFTHQISPILTAAALLVLVLFIRLRPRYLIGVLLIPFLVWDLMHLSAFSQYASAKSIGDVSNFAPPSSGSRASHALIVVLAAALSAARLAYIGLAAVLSGLTVRTRQVFALLACASVHGGTGGGDPLRLRGALPHRALLPSVAGDRRVLSPPPRHRVVSKNDESAPGESGDRTPAVVCHVPHRPVWRRCDVRHPTSDPACGAGIREHRPGGVSADRGRERFGADQGHAALPALRVLSPVEVLPARRQERQYRRHLPSRISKRHWESSPRNRRCISCSRPRPPTTPASGECRARPRSGSSKPHSWHLRTGRS